MTETRKIEDQLIELIRTSEAASGENCDLSTIGPDCMDRFERFDWQSYVPKSIRGLWPGLSLEARLWP